MSLSRVYVDEQVERSLRNLQARTQLTPNLLCRIGFCYSLSDKGIPDPKLYQDGRGKEFNLSTLTGEYNEYFFALLRQRLYKDGVDIEDNFEDQFIAHISRGVINLNMRVQNIEDIAKLVTDANKS